MKKKDTLSNLMLVFVFLVGLSLLLYPSFSDYWNSFHQTQAVVQYAEYVAEIDDELYKEILDSARTYNKTLLMKKNLYLMSDGDMSDYMSQLSVSDKGIMAYIEIPVIDVKLPIYHTVDDGVLQVAIGHIEWSSLPVGGMGTHTVLSGHRGLPSARLFTDLDRVGIGDYVMIHVLDETLTYEVDQILIVEPYEVDTITIEEDKDYLTLVTCTPYGVNSHRLLVRGHRVENQKVVQTLRVTADAIQIEPMMVAPIVAAPMLLGLLIVLLVSTRKKK